ncbi:hypothetical protein BGZ49_009476, partial [Haplosporangium sp. Z 27]
PQEASIPIDPSHQHQDSVKEPRSSLEDSKTMVEEPRRSLSEPNPRLHETMNIDEAIDPARRKSLVEPLLQEQGHHLALR